MEEYFRYHSWAEDSKKDADNIKHAIDVLKRLIADKYLFESEGVEKGDVKEYELQINCFFCKRSNNVIQMNVEKWTEIWT